MKQLFAIILALVMMVSLCACGKKPAQTTPTSMPGTATVPTTAPTTAATTPIPEPTMETNIPDPSVDTSMPDATDLLPTEGATEETGTPEGRSRAKMK